MTPRIGWRERWRLLDAAIATACTGRHHYLSTACLHGDHDYCNGAAGHVGLKAPRRCKFCPAGCTGPAHEPSAADQDAGQQ